jgi:hypothetical protein
MYTWREIFQLYLQAEIFIGNTEADRDEHDLEITRKQFKWFSDEISKKDLVILIILITVRSNLEISNLNSIFF